MAYCTQAQIEARIPELANAYAESPEKFGDIVAAAIVWAQTQVDFHLSMVYSVPFESVPDAIAQIAADLAASFVLDSSFSGGGEAQASAMSSNLRQRGQVCLDLLRERKVTIPSSQIVDAIKGMSVGYCSGTPNKNQIENLRW